MNTQELKTAASSRMSKTWTYAKNHKLIVGLVFIIVAGGIYGIVRAATSTAEEVRYVIGEARTSSLSSTISAVGQVSTSQSIDIKPSVSGDITSVRVASGDKVTKGQLLFVVDAGNARSSLERAELDLKSARSQQAALEKSQAKAVATAYTNLLSNGLQAQPTDILTSAQQAPTISGNYRLDREGEITVTTYSSSGGVSFEFSGIVSGYGLISTVTPQAIGDSGLYILFPSGIKGGFTWNISIPNKNSSSYTSNLNAYQNALDDQAEALDPNGATQISLQSKELSLKEQQEALADYYVRAPFSGVMASVSAKAGDSASSGTSLGTIVTEQKVATLSLNEVDVSQIKVGDNASLTFDAIDDLTLSGTVSEISQIGTVTSGVVSYDVKIAFDKDDERVKSGMTVTADITTQSVENAVVVPSSAIKSERGGSYVLTVPASTETTRGMEGVDLEAEPTRTRVETGISNETMTQIVSGLSAGDKIVTRSITTGASSTSSSQAPSATSILGGSRGGATSGMPNGGMRTMSR